MKNTLQSLGFVMLWIVGLAATAFIVLALIYGAEWLSVAVYPLIVPTLFWTLVSAVTVSDGAIFTIGDGRAPSAFATTAPDLLRIGAAGQRAAARREV